MALTGDGDVVKGPCCSQVCSTIRFLNLEPEGPETNWRLQEAGPCEGGSGDKGKRGFSSLVSAEGGLVGLPWQQREESCVHELCGGGGQTRASVGRVYPGDTFILACAEVRERI